MRALQIVVVRTAAIAVAPLLFAACAGVNPLYEPGHVEGTINPEGDEGDDEDVPRPGSGTSTSGDDGSMDVDDGGDPDDGGATSGDDDAPAPTTGTDDEGAPEPTGAPQCEPDEAICDGACTNIDHDRHACGVDCIDCTTIFGDDARCMGGQCEEHPDNDHDDDDGGPGGHEESGTGATDDTATSTSDDASADDD